MADPTPAFTAFGRVTAKIASCEQLMRLAFGEPEVEKARRAGGAGTSASSPIDQGRSSNFPTTLGFKFSKMPRSSEIALLDLSLYLKQITDRAGAEEAIAGFGERPSDILL